MFRRLWPVVLLAGAAACSEYQVKPGGDGVNGPAPDIVVSPSSLAFARLQSGEDEVQTFNVKNVGASTLNVSNVVIGSGIAFSILGPETTFDLEPEESVDVDVSFTPMGADENFGQALVMSDDPDTPEAPVDLLGYGKVPELQITPDSYVFGDAFIPCGSSVELELKNVGSEDLVITELDYRSGGDMTLDAAALEAELPVTLAPGELRYVTVYFAPSTTASDTGVLDVTSNDPRGVVSADQNGEGSFGGEQTEVFTEAGIPPVDLILLIDRSGSMQDNNIDDVENGIPLFVQELNNVADWQLIEVTADDGCANGNVLTPSTPNVEQLLIDHAWDGGLFNQALTESLLKLADVALGKTGPGQCNDGFLRPGALLHVIAISDENEQSGKTGQYWVTQYESYVAAPEFVKVSAVVDINRRCGDNSGPGGYDDAVAATGGSLLNICNANWGADFADLASGVLAGVRTYNLSYEAAPETIVVTINGVPTTDFEYSSAGNSVTILSPAVGEGDVVEITYQQTGEC